jgi:hypothetical protein
VTNIIKTKAQLKLCFFNPQIHKNTFADLQINKVYLVLQNQQNIFCVTISITKNQQLNCIVN